MENRINEVCIQCRWNKYVKVADVLNGEMKENYLSDLKDVFDNIPDGIMAGQIIDPMKQKYPELFKEMDYSQIKKKYNDLISGYQDEINQKIQHCQDQLAEAIKYSIVGNYIDFTAIYDVSDDILQQMIESVSQQQLNPQVYQSLCDDLQTCKKMTFISDNCGEIVLDKILIQTIQRFYPDIEITLMVRGAEVVNDASMVDAKQVGIDKICKVIGNGNNIAGTIMNKLSEEALQCLNESDVIIAKGQANIESLIDCDMNIYYLLLCKCAYIAQKYDAVEMSGFICSEKLRQKKKKEGNI